MTDETPQAEAQPQVDIMSFYRPPFTGRAYYDDSELDVGNSLTN